MEPYRTCMAFCVWLLSLSIMFSGFIPVAWICTSFLFMVAFQCVGITTFCFDDFCVRLSVDGHLSFFYFLAIMNATTMTIRVQTFVWTPVFHFFCCILRGGVDGSYKVLFNLLRNPQPVFHSWCSILRSHQQGTRVSVSPHPCQHLGLSVFLILVIRVCVK